MPTYGEAVCFCGPAPRVTAPGRYPAACSVEFGLSSGGSKSARDRLELFGVTIIALRTFEVNTSEQIDIDTHLVYLRARWYDPAVALADSYEQEGSASGGEPVRHGHPEDWAKEYTSNSTTEDWAESLASVVYRGYYAGWQALGPLRRQYVQDKINAMP